MGALVRQFRLFLRDEVNPNMERVPRLRSCIRGVRDHLRINLHGFQRIDRQGSLSLDTLIKPVQENDEYDADVQVVMNPRDSWEPKDYLDAVHETLAQNMDYRDKLQPGTRCVKIRFANNFSMDIVPRITSGQRHQICNGVDNRFEETDGVGYQRWFHAQSKITNINLKRAVRLMKYVRDHEDSYIAKSIMLTTLAARTIHEDDRGTDQVKSVAATLATILARMDTDLQSQTTNFNVTNPVLPSERFDRHWEDGQFEIFRASIHRYAEIANGTLTSESVPESIKRWRRLFGPGFGRHWGAPRRKSP